MNWKLMILAFAFLSGSVHAGTLVVKYGEVVTEAKLAFFRTVISEKDGKLYLQVSGHQSNSKRALCYISVEVAHNADSSLGNLATLLASERGGISCELEGYSNIAKSISLFSAY